MWKVYWKSPNSKRKCLNFYVHISPVQNIQEDQGNDDENDVENYVEPEDKVLDDIDIDDGLGNEEQKTEIGLRLIFWILERCHGLITITVLT